jgi:hypothetical protein
MIETERRLQAGTTDMSRETSGASAFASRGLGFRLRAGIVFVVVVAGLLAYLLPSPAQWRHSIGTFVASLPIYRQQEPSQPSQQASAQNDNVVWMSLAPEKSHAQTPGAPVALTLSGVKGSYSLREAIELEIRNSDAGAAAWYVCTIEQRQPEGWREVAPRVDNAPSSCTSRISSLAAGQALNIAWSPLAEPRIKPGEYRFSVRAHREKNAPSQAWTELHSQPFVIK